MELKKITLWYYIVNCGDGSVCCKWFLTEKEAENYENKEVDNGDGWAEEAVYSIETFSGSDVHEEAKKFKSDEYW